MSKLRCILVMLAAFALSLSFVVPANDAPETPYDESEALPYESTPLFSITLQKSAGVLQSALTLAFLLHSHPRAIRDETVTEQLVRTPHPICGSVTILDHSLRC